MQETEFKIKSYSTKTKFRILKVIALVASERKTTYEWQIITFQKK